MSRTTNALAVVGLIAMLAAWIFGSAWLWKQAAAKVQAGGIGAVNQEIAPLRDVPFFLESDSYVWCLLAERALEGGAWRIREMDFDNAPFGRPNHWSSGPSCFLGLVAGVDRGLTGASPRSAVAQAALLWNPLIHFILCATFVLGLWRLSRTAAVTASMALAVMPPLQWVYHVARPDHHGLQLLLLFAMFLLLYRAGFGSDEGALNASPAKLRLACASGALAGAALWSGAPAASIFFAGLVSGVVLAVFLAPRGNSYARGFWRAWGWAAGVSSLIFYLVEYAPDFPGLRLEMNHPWYSLFMVGVGEFLEAVSRLWAGEYTLRCIWPRLLLLLAVVLSLPAALIFGGEAVHVMHGETMRRVHDILSEFGSYAGNFRDRPLGRFLSDFGLFALIPIMAARVLAGRGRATGLRCGLIISLSVCGVFLAASLMQLRWTPFLAASLAFIGAVAIVATRDHAALSRWIASLLILQCAVWMGLSVRSTALAWTTAQMPEAVVALAEKKAATELAKIPNIKDAVFAGDANLAPELAYFAGAKSVPSFYWENAAGLKDNIELMSSTDEESIRKHLRTRGITHLVVNETPDFARSFSYLAQKPEDMGSVKKTLSGRLAAGNPPVWLHRLDALSAAAQQPLKCGDVSLSLHLAFYEVER